MKLSLIIYGCRSLDSVPHSAAHRPSVGTQRLYQLEHHISLLCSAMAPGLGLLLGKNTQGRIVFHMWATGSREKQGWGDVRIRRFDCRGILVSSINAAAPHGASEEKHGNIIDLSQKIYSDWGWFEIEKKVEGGGETERWSKVGGIACLDGLDGWQKRNQTYGRNTHFPIFAFSFDRLELTLKQVVISILFITSIKYLRIF